MNPGAEGGEFTGGMYIGTNVVLTLDRGDADGCRDTRWMGSVQGSSEHPFARVDTSGGAVLHFPPMNHGRSGTWPKGRLRGKWWNDQMDEPGVATWDEGRPPNNDCVECPRCLRVSTSALIKEHMDTCTACDARGGGRRSSVGRMSETQRANLRSAVRGIPVWTPG